MMLNPSITDFTKKVFIFMAAFLVACLFRTFAEENLKDTSDVTVKQTATQVKRKAINAIEKKEPVNATVSTGKKKAAGKAVTKKESLKAATSTAKKKA
ncbi:MAG: hypothetical protein JW881_04830, partial [Spirochaetales bacterium]|nr:hypothetical protein [Spirochaetales bacterium]